MTRRLRVEWRPGRRVDALLRMPPEGGSTGIVLAHGAGAGQRHAFMAGLRNRLAASGFPTMTFDYPYLDTGRRAPDRPEVLLACHRAAARRLQPYVDRVILAGKSMGGRMASHLAARGEPAAGLVVYGYPLVPVGKSVPRSTAHLRDVDAPMLFIAGDRDRMAPLPMLEEVVGGLARARLEVMAGADHSFRLPARSGRSDTDVLEQLVSISVEWIGSITS
jgi:predicted alpha/beta-hydrolase family hydrolase